MPEQKILVIDIGTNSVLALLAVVKDGKLVIISDQKKTTKLGEGLMMSGLLSYDAMNRTTDAISKFIADSPCNDIMLIGTEALRIAKNSPDFAQMLFEKTGQMLSIISGEIEAELSYLGATYDFNKLTG